MLFILFEKKQTLVVITDMFNACWGAHFGDFGNSQNLFDIFCKLIPALLKVVFLLWKEVFMKKNWVRKKHKMKNPSNNSDKFSDLMSQSSIFLQFWISEDSCI